jgi:exopolysaccharide production protein ExoQ
VKTSSFLKNVEVIFHICMILLLMGAFVPLWRLMTVGAVDQLEGDPVQRGILLAGYLVAFTTLLLFPKSFIRTAWKKPLIWILILWAAASILWSNVPWLTLRRVIALTLTSLYTFVLFLRFPPGYFLRLLGWALLIAVLSSLLTALLLPNWGVMGFPTEYAWQGVFVHKNILGRISALALLVSTLLWNYNQGWRIRAIWGAVFIMSTITLVESRSASALVLTIVMALGALAILTARRWHWHISWPVLLPTFLVVLGTSAFIIMRNYETFLAILGRSSTLTGRIPLWEVVVAQALNRPWTGYGYGVFWLGWNGPSAAVWAAVSWLPPHAHNGYLDLWLDLGLIGLMMGVILLGKTLLISMRSVLIGSKEALFWALFVLFVVVYNIVESTFLRANNIYWTMLVYSYLMSEHKSDPNKL